MNRMQKTPKDIKPPFNSTTAPAPAALPQFAPPPIDPIQFDRSLRSTLFTLEMTKAVFLLALMAFFTIGLAMVVNEAEDVDVLDRMTRKCENKCRFSSKARSKAKRACSGVRGCKVRRCFRRMGNRKMRKGLKCGRKVRKPVPTPEIITSMA